MRVKTHPPLLAITGLQAHLPAPPPREPDEPCLQGRCPNWLNHEWVHWYASKHHTDMFTASKVGRIRLAGYLAK